MKLKYQKISCENNIAEAFDQFGFLIRKKDFDFSLNFQMKGENYNIVEFKQRVLNKSF